MALFWKVYDGDSDPLDHESLLAVVQAKTAQEAKEIVEDEIHICNEELMALPCQASDPRSFARRARVLFIWQE